MIADWAKPGQPSAHAAKASRLVSSSVVKAGSTGWALVNDRRGDSDLGKRVQFDLYYIENWSLWFDLRILTLTVWRVFHSRSAH